MFALLSDVISIQELIMFGSGGPATVVTRGGRERDTGQAEADNERAAALEHVAARKRRIGLDVGHRASPAILVEASWMALRISG